MTWMPLKEYQLETLDRLAEYCRATGELWARRSGRKWVWLGGQQGLWGSRGLLNKLT
jgi:hypothetical protein